MNIAESKFSITGRVKSFKHALNGFIALLKNEHNFRIHLFVATVAIVSGIYLHISLSEWCVIIFAITVVLIAEAINSSIEMLADVVSMDFNEKIKLAKDYGAFAVFICSIAALICGLIIFIPKIVAIL